MEWLFVVGFLVVVCLILSPVAFFMVLSAGQRLREMETRLGATRNRLEAAERRLQLLEAGGVIPPPLPQTDIAPEAPPAVALPPPIPSTADQPPEAVSAAADSPPPKPPEVPPPPPPVLPATPPQPPRSIEESLGTRWAVIVGGIALALGALLLVRFSIEQGWFGPGARVTLGLVLAVGLVAAGEILRRRARTAAASDAAASRESASPLSIPAVLTAAGTVAAFGSVYAAHALYGFIGPTFAFLALGAIGLISILAAALHGPALGAVGLIAALTAPLLVSSNEPNPWPVVIYVAVITACTYGLARLRYWLWLALAAAAGAFIWGLLLDTGAFSKASLAHAVLQTFLAVLLFVAGRRSTLPDSEKTQDWMSIGVPSAFAFLALLALSWSGFQFDADALIGVGLIVAILLAAGLRAFEAAGLCLTAGVLFFETFVLWPDAPLRHGAVATHWQMPSDANLFCFCMILGSAALAFFPARQLWTAPNVRQTVAAIFAATACLVPLAVLGIAYLRLHMAFGNSLLAATAGVVSFIALFAATLFRNRTTVDNSPALRLALGAFAATALSALTLGLIFQLERGTLTIALALSALGAAFVDRRLDIPSLRWCVLGLGLIVAARLALDPQIVGTDLGTTPIFNWLLAGYGIPAAAFALSARWMRARSEDPPVHVAQGLAILLAVFLVFFETRHALNGGDPFAPTFGFLEQGLFATESFAFAIFLTKLDAARSNIILRGASLGFGVLSFALSLIGLIIIENPLMSSISIEGGTFFNTLWLAYLLPAVLALILNHVARGVRPEWYRLCARICAYALFFTFLNLQLRHIFKGEILNLLSTTSAGEFYSYSALWLALGIVFLGLGIWRRSNEARIVSIILVAMAVGKVFIFDLTGLSGILRAFSFIVLGFVLIGIGFVYQKFVFARPSSSA